MTDPFRIAGPAVISFSGGRTSGFMLWRILQAHGGSLPENVVVCFANTGREMPATLDFVRDCGVHWNVPIVWLEFLARKPDGYRVVAHHSAARNGEPFSALLVQQSALPNAVQRSCTTELKIRSIKRWVVRELRWRRWDNVVGLRADEQNRLERVRQPTTDQWTICTPLAAAGIALEDITAFWSQQNFDLQLAGKWEGNCDGCFQKSRAAIMRMQRDHPERMQWWADMENIPRGSSQKLRRFRSDREPYAVMADYVARTPRLPFDEGLIEGGEACGMWCGV